nr:MAG TPA: hypothetical protein [Caudoviricetes sp.]
MNAIYKIHKLRLWKKWVMNNRKHDFYHRTIYDNNTYENELQRADRILAVLK